uniref:Proteoglycan 4a n=1 Tax=Astyanax mexicanus TaxID=7994 RepID=A0A8B9H2J5_ASTMX
MAGSALISSLVLMTCVLLPLCAAQGSCRGRCGEPFIRGQLCNCDHSCLTHNECCKDYEEACTFRGSCRGRCGEEFQRGRECECDPDCTLYNTCCSDYHGQCGTALIFLSFVIRSVCTNTQNQLDHLDNGNIHIIFIFISPFCLGGSAGGPLQPGASSPSAPGKPLTIPIRVSLSITGQAGGPLGGGAGGPLGGAAGGPLGGGAGGVDQCSRTVYCDIMYQINKNISLYLRVLQGDQYWVFENGVMEPGYPRSLSQDFDGLSGEITAALSVPATRKRPESIYFFKKGGTVQKYSYPAGSGPTCTGKKNKNSVYNKIRRARQAGTLCGRSKVFNIKISGEFPTLTSPAKPPAQQSDIRNWLYCP